VPPQNEYDVSKGYTYLYFKGVPLYPFGHGLSYTRFEYSHLTIASKVLNAKGTVDVSFDVTNAGDRAGSDVAQLYSHQEKSAVVQPIKSLRAFQRVTLRPGETQRVTFSLPARMLAFYDVRVHDFVVDPGTYDLLIGCSSEDIRLRSTIRVGTSEAASAVHADSKKGAH